MIIEFPRKHDWTEWGAGLGEIVAIEVWHVNDNNLLHVVKFEELVE